MTTDQKSSELSKLLLEWSTLFMRVSLREFNHYTRSIGISITQMTVLMHLYYQGDAPLVHFCEMMEITPAAASQMIERMVQQGLVSRKEIPEDRRVRMVEITEKGRKLIDESIVARQTWVDALIASLPDHDRQLISQALTTLTAHAVNLEQQSASITVTGDVQDASSTAETNS